MKQTRVDFVLEAAQPIAHHQESIGNMAVAMRRKVRLRDGRWAQVPVVTADTMRHGLREAATYALLDAAGMLEAPNLSEAALRLLFAGGMVTGSAGGAVKLGDYHELCELIPPLALLGGCAQNRVIPGRIHVDDAVLICEETAHLLPAWVGEWMGETALDTCRVHVEEQQRVRMDPGLDPGKRKLLTAGDAEGIQQRLLKSESASAMGDSLAKADEKSSMMPRRFERICAGSLFHWSVEATTYSDIEESALWTMVGSFLANARVGGKKGTGHGLLRVVATREIPLLRHRERAEDLDPRAVAAEHLARFQAHVGERAERVRTFLSEVAA